MSKIPASLYNLPAYDIPEDFFQILELTACSKNTHTITPPPDPEPFIKEKTLYAAVLLLAVRDFLNPPRIQFIKRKKRPSKFGPNDFVSVYEWFAAPQIKSPTAPKPPVSFHQCCYALNLSPKKVRHKLMELKLSNKYLRNSTISLDSKKLLKPIKWHDLKE
jgi:hypothetical protein